MQLDIVKKHSHEIVLFLVLALAAYIYFHNLPLARFESEMARDLIISEEILGGNIRLEGITAEIDAKSPQQSFGPLYYYLIALALFIKNSFLSAAALVATLNLLAVLFCYVLCAKFFNKNVALMAAALFAFNPWFVTNWATVLTTPSFLPIFVTLLFFSLFRVIIGGDEKYIVAVFVLQAMLLQFHLSALLLAPVALLALFLHRKIKLKHLGAAIFISALLFLPFAYYNFTSGDAGSITSFLKNRYESSRLENLRDSTGIPLMLATNYLGKYLLGDTQLFGAELQSYFLAITVLSALLLLFGLLFVVKNALRNKKLGLLLLWFLVPIILAVLPGKNVSPHYLLIIYPMQFIAMAVFSDKLIKQNKLFALVPLIIVLSNVALLFGFFSYIDEHGGTHGTTSSTYESKLDAIMFVKANYAGSPEVYFFKTVKRDFIYLISKTGVQAKYGTVEAVSDLKNGYLILDVDGAYSFSEKTLSESDFAAMEKYAHNRFGMLEVLTPA